MKSKEPVLPWKSFADGKITEVENNFWVVRMGVVVNKPIKHKKYEDSYVSLHCMTSSSKSTLGYSLRAKREFHQKFQQETYLSLLADIEKHKNPDLVYEDQKVRLYRFNSQKNPSYWFLVRYRPSEAK